MLASNPVVDVNPPWTGSEFPQSNGRVATQQLESGWFLDEGIFGILRPILLRPERLTVRLEDENVTAILAHELEHARR